MAYVDYNYYRGVYFGDAVPVADFYGLSRQASAYLDQVTFGRIRGGWEQDSRVKDACCAIVNILYRQEQGGEVASASNDGYSETYVTSGRTTAQRMYAAAEQYLSMTGLMCRSVNA